MNLADICDNAKKGREYALLGNYDSSIVYYQGVIQQIHKHCQSLRDPALKAKWLQVSVFSPLNISSSHLVINYHYRYSVMQCLIQYSSSSVSEQVRQELHEEFEQVKDIMGTLEGFRSEKPADVLAPQSGERPEDPAVWPPPTPVEHRCVCVCLDVTSIT